MEPDDVVVEGVAVAVVVEDAATVEAGDFQSLDRAVVRIVIKGEADRTAARVRAVDLDNGLAVVARLRRPVDDRRVGERWQRLHQGDRLRAAGGDVEVDCRDRADRGVVGRDDRGTK